MTVTAEGEWVGVEGGEMQPQRTAPTQGGNVWNKPYAGVALSIVESLEVTGKGPVDANVLGRFENCATLSQQLLSE